MPAMDDQDTLLERLDPTTLSRALRQARADSLALVTPLSSADRLLSGALWHLGHTTWFIEHYLLRPFSEGPLVGHPLYDERFARPSPPAPRPDEDAIRAYRQRVDAALMELLASDEPSRQPQILALAERALHHELRHQETLLEDVLQLYLADPFHPAYREAPRPTRGPETTAPGWIRHPGGEVWIGHDGDGFAFEDERPRHRRWLPPFQLADRLVNNGEYLQFIEDGGYRRPELWLPEGWRHARRHDWRHPGHWFRLDERWWVMTLHGLLPLDPAAPVSHLSYYEADAYARWAGARLPDEVEWEAIAAQRPLQGPFRATGPFLPQTSGDGFFGTLWQWTRSPYAPYPGHRPPAVTTAEFDGRFPPNEAVLRGGACITPRAAFRLTVREHAPVHQRRRFTGLRLARDAH